MSTQETPTKKSKIWLYVGIALVIIVAVVVAAVLVLQGRTPSGGITQGPTVSGRITQVIIKVEYSGSWQGAYGDQTTITSWSGTGTKTVTLTRPSDASIWIISANAQKLDGSENILKIMIMKTDGTVLKEASTSAPYGVAQISYTIQD